MFIYPVIFTSITQDENGINQAETILHGTYGSIHDARDAAQELAQYYKAEGYQVRGIVEISGRFRAISDDEVAEISILSQRVNITIGD